MLGTKDTRATGRGVIRETIGILDKFGRGGMNSREKTSLERSAVSFIDYDILGPSYSVNCDEGFP
jgi:hypothetical protein